MISRGRTLAAALALCVLSLCAFAAASASATELTAVTCKEESLGHKYSSSHCDTPATEGSFETVALPLNTTTEVEGTSTEGEPALRATIGGFALTVKCETAHVVGGKLTNEEPSAGKHKIKITMERITASNCHAVLKTNEARFCAVEGVTEPGGLGMISTTAIKGEPTGVEHKIKVEPSIGGAFTKVTVLKKGSVPGTEKECFFTNNVALEVAGSLEGDGSTSNHSHLTWTEANNGTGLKANGATANFVGTVGLYMTGAPGTSVGAETFT